MKQRSFNFRIARAFAVAALAMALFSFSPEPGGDSFAIYQDDRLLLKQYLHGDPSIRTISLLPQSGEGVLKVYYSHCGKVGTSRKVTIADGGTTLTSVEFADSRGQAHEAMILNVKDIVAYCKGTGEQRVNLVYFSSEIPEGKVLARMSAGELSTRKNQ